MLVFFASGRHEGEMLSYLYWFRYLYIHDRTVNALYLGKYTNKAHIDCIVLYCSSREPIVTTSLLFSYNLFSSLITSSLRLVCPIELPQ